MRTLSLILVLLASSAFAQPSVSRGGALKKRQYQTYSTLTYYVDPTGSDSNACTASGTAACATFNGIYAKLPRFLRHNVTVNVAAGNYTFDSRWDGAQWSSADASGTTSPTVEFLGPSLVNVTPSTGTATGTITSLVATQPPLPTITDSGQSWTTNDLRGYFLIITSGAAANQVATITGNTATTLTHTPWGSATVPAPGDTYAIQRPGAIITGLHTVQSHQGSGTLRFTQLEFTSASTASAAMLALNSLGPSIPVTAGMSRFVRTAGSFPVISISDGRAIYAQGSSYGGSGGPTMAVLSLGAGTPFSSSGLLGSIILRGYFYASTATGALLVRGSGALNSWQRIVAEVASTSAFAVPITFAGSVSGDGSGLSYNWMYATCPAGGTGTGIRVNNFVNMTMGGPIGITNCNIGVALGTSAGSSTAYANGVATMLGTSAALPVTLSCTNTTTCLNVARGSRYMNPFFGTPTFTGVTNEYVVDDTTYTHSFVNSLTPKRVTGNAGSILELE